MSYWGRLSQWGRYRLTHFDFQIESICNVPTDSLTGGEKYGSLPTPTRYGYTFNGWHDTNESGYRVSATDIVNRNITLCAAWTPIRTSVLFYGNFVGDNGFYQEEYADYDNTYARALGCISEPVNDGYTFLGWFTKATGGNKVTASTVVKSEDVIKLYAHWEKNVVELKTAKVSKAGAVSIPATVKISGKTYKVTGIRAKAFRKKTKIKKVTIGKNVTKIGAQAFEGCTALTTVSGGAAVKIIDAKAFTGMGSSKTVIKVPKGKTKTYKSLFQKKDLNKKIKIK